MRTLDYMTLVTNGFIGFLIAAIGNGLCYFAANLLAQSVSFRRWVIYLTKLAVVLTLSALWIGYCGRVAAEGMAGNLNDPYFWYRWARHEGMGFGALSVCAWIIVALIDRPKARCDKIQAATLGQAASQSALTTHTP
jgi:hypothetical protein